ncbi:MAG: PQQ-binding-like beta-propeller repeat protein [Phycisphaerales bacterium]
MRRLWSVDAAALLNLPEGDPDRNTGGACRPMANSWEEVVQPALALGSSLVVAVVGREYDNALNVEGEERLVAFDALSGAVRYAVPLRSLDDQVSDAFSRGPLVSDGRVVVVNMLKRQNQRRLLANILVGIDAQTGAKLWTRTVASAGLLPFTRASALTDDLTVRDGVVYRYDRLGAAGAYAIDDGRPLWVRRLSTKVVFESPPSQQPWLVHHPQVTSEGLVVLSPDRDELLVIDAQTGAIKARRNAADLLNPEYLVTTSTHLVAVGKSQIATLPLGEIAAGTPRVSPKIGSSVGGIRGRVTVAGQTVVVPTAAGVTILNPADPTRTVRTLALDEPGSPLALPEGLLVVDDARAHMYCTWSVASSHLNAQIAASPADAGPAVELLRLAERAGKAADMLPAADSALAALERTPPPSASVADASTARSVIVTTLLRSRAVGWCAGGAAGREARRRGGRRGAAARRGRGGDSERQSRGEARIRARERVSQRMERCGIELPGDRRRPVRCAAPGPGTAGGSTALVTAVERLSRVVKQGGRPAYAAFDREADSAASALKPDAPAEEIERLALLYPVAQHGPDLWLRAAEAYATLATPTGAGDVALAGTWRAGGRARRRRGPHGGRRAERAAGAEPDRPRPAGRSGRCARSRTAPVPHGLAAHGRQADRSDGGEGLDPAGARVSAALAAGRYAAERQGAASDRRVGADGAADPPWRRRGPGRERSICGDAQGRRAAHAGGAVRREAGRTEGQDR